MLVARAREVWAKTEPAGSVARRAAVFGAWAASKGLESGIDAYFLHQGLRTAGKGGELWGSAAEYHWYAPTPWPVLFQVIQRDGIGSDDVLLDYGSGMGRVAIWAAWRFPLRRAIGVELDADLCALAEENLARWHGRPLRCADVQFLRVDATLYEVPDDVTVVYLANPFHGEAFDQVLTRLRESVDRKPRVLRIFYVWPRMHEVLIEAGFQLERARRRSWAAIAPADSTSDGMEGASRSLPPYRWSVYRSPAVSRPSTT